jgi:hypothetical protein
MARLPDMTADDEIAARIRARRGGELRAATDPEPSFSGPRPAGSRVPSPHQPHQSDARATAPGNS